MFIGSVVVDAIIVGLPDFDQGIADGIAASIEYAAGKVRDLTGSRREGIVHDDQVVVRVQWKMIRIKRPFGLPRRADQFLSEGAGDGAKSREEGGAFKKGAPVRGDRIHEP